MVCLAWVFFRAQSIDGAFDVLGQLVHRQRQRSALVTPLLILTVVAMHRLAVRARPRSRQKAEVVVRPARPRRCRSVALAVGLVLVDALGPEGIAPFIYFQF